jgi:hypothetical protein
VGDFVGALVGALVGDLVGALVGDFVGDLVGDFVGDLVGDFVGALVGAFVAHISFCPPLVLFCAEVVALQTLGISGHLNNEEVTGVVLDSATRISVDVRPCTPAPFWAVIVPPPYDKKSTNTLFGPVNAIPPSPPFGNSYPNNGKLNTVYWTTPTVVVTPAEKKNPFSAVPSPRYIRIMKFDSDTPTGVTISMKPWTSPPSALSS